MSYKRLDAVDGLRGIAIFMVIYQHTYSVKLREVVTNTTGFYPWLIGHAWTGVGVFFILSGFVLALPFVAERNAFSAKKDYSHFYLRRAKRLLPLFIFVAMVSYLVTVHAGAPANRSLLLSLSTGSMFTRDEFFPTINGPFWSLAVEIWFSLLFPFILLAMKRYGVVRTVFAVSALALLVRLFGTHFSFVNLQTNPLKDSVIARADDFTIGMAIAFFYVRGTLPKLRAEHALLGIAFVAFAALLWDFQPNVRAVAIATFNIPLQIGVSIILVAALNEGSRTAKLLSMWPLKLAGAMCFSLYCWHALLIGPTVQAAPFALNSIFVMWVPLLVLASFTYRFIEFPTVSPAKLFRIGRQSPVAAPLKSEAV